MNHFLVSQANQHIAPLINARALLHRVVGRALGDALLAEVKHRFKQTAMFLPSSWAKATRLMTQKWEGDVTFVLPIWGVSLLRLITDMDPQTLLWAWNAGQVCGG